MTLVRDKRKDAAAAQEIELFAKRLLSLTGGRTIPRQWKHQLAKALRAQPKQRGRKIDIELYAGVVKDLVERSDQERAPRTKSNSPASKRREIAARHMCEGACSIPSSGGSCDHARPSLTIPSPLRSAKVVERGHIRGQNYDVEIRDPGGHDYCCSNSSYARGEIGAPI